MSAPLRQQATEAPAAGGHLVGGECRRGSPGDGGERPREPAAALCGDSGEDAGPGEEAERPPEGAVCLGFLLNLDLSRPGLAQLLGQPLRRLPFSLRGRGALDRAELIKPLAEPFWGRGRCDRRWGLGGDRGNLASAA
jgi:hypothetical protein